MNRKLIALLLMVLPNLAAVAAPVDVASAKQVAADVLGQHLPLARVTRAAATFQLSAELPGAYVVTRSDGAFALVASDDALPQVLGYGSHMGGEVPQQLTDFLTKYKAAATNLTARRLTATATTAVAPLLKTVRSQSAPFNNSCPYYTSKGTTSTSRCLVGCVATALEQVLTYYRYPSALTDTLHGWKTDNYTIGDVLPGTVIDWNHILDVYSAGYSAEQAKAVADLDYYCGVLSKMQWGLEASGANVYPLADQVKRAFGYGFTKYLDSYRYRPEDWVTMIAGEIQAGRPVLYAGYTSQIQGHAFVLDGLDDTGLFHVNWGYGGSFDGYFALDVLWPFGTVEEGNPDSQGFFCNQEAVLMYPQAISPVLPDTLAKTGHELRVDSLRFLRQPDKNNYVTMLLSVTNTTSQSLTTPLEFMTNAPADTALFEQADYVAITGTRLAPGESAQVKVRCSFDKWGDRIFSISPDDSTIIWQQKLRIDSTAAAQLTYGNLNVTVDGTSILGVQDIDNTGEGWAGNMVQYYVCEGTTLNFGNALLTANFLNIAPGTSAKDSVRFSKLKPLTLYTLWTVPPGQIKQHASFTTGQQVGISSVSATDADEPLYDLSGRRVASGSRAHGVYISNKKNKIMR